MAHSNSMNTHFCLVDNLLYVFLSVLSQIMPNHCDQFSNCVVTEALYCKWDWFDDIFGDSLSLVVLQYLAHCHCQYREAFFRHLSSQVTFLSPQVHLNCGVSPGVQDLPGNDTHNGHPVFKKRVQRTNQGTDCGFHFFFCKLKSCFVPYNESLWSFDTEGLNYKCWSINENEQILDQTLQALWSSV